MFIKDDLPTLLRPIKANSGLSGGGQPLLSELLFKNFADFISIIFDTRLKRLFSSSD
jgi:hypothetical protein